MNTTLQAISMSQTDKEADDLISRHIEARGGLDRIMAITTLRQSGKVKMGQEGNAWLQLYAEKKRPEQIRIEFTFNRMKGVEGFDGEHAWEMNPWKGMAKAEYVTGQPALALQRGAEFDGPLVGYREKGHVVKYIGTEEQDGAEFHHLEITRNDANVIHYYLDPQTLLVARTISVRPVHGSEPIETHTSYEDYREVNGVLFPFQSTEWARGGEHKELFIWESIEANVPLEDTRFTLPL